MRKTKRITLREKVFHCTKAMKQQNEDKNAQFDVYFFTARSSFVMPIDRYISFSTLCPLDAANLPL